MTVLLWRGPLYRIFLHSTKRVSADAYGIFCWALLLLPSYALVPSSLTLLSGVGAGLGKVQREHNPAWHRMPACR